MTDERPRNRLADETSPYLQQHAYNPVDWFPWGDEAITRARELNKPIFLSIGYSACHWCHVMEHESFENDDIAAVMNEHYVCIKVDREERPDLDQIYMNSVQLLTGRGGWPMSVFLTPDLHPFYGGTYWPPHARQGMPGFHDILLGVNEAWVEKRDRVDAQAAELTNAVAQASGIRVKPTQLDVSLLTNAERALLRSADRTHGGFGGAPKFPHPMDVRVLLRTWRRFGNIDALSVVTQTLDLMSRGGIYDQLGGGFHRYSTDAHWLAPHFEKMLYDNALLAPAYIEAYQATGNEDYARVARETLDYVLREMTQPEGGFYSTQDADSEGEEGKFFVWYEDEIMELLGSDDGQLFCYCYDVTSDGNWEGKSILNRPKPHAQAAQVLDRTPEELEAVLSRGRAKLFAARSKRIAPGRDDKVLASWNGLMIAAMARASTVLDEPRYAAAASEAAAFILNSMREEGGRLLHSFKDGRARFNAYLDDYACLIDGLLELCQATGEGHWLTSAIELAERLFEQFADTEAGGFFYTSSDHEELITRAKDCQDNATPSGNGMAAYALLRLARITARPDIEQQAVATLEALSGQMDQLALASGQSLLALDWLLGPTYELVLCEGDEAAANRLAGRLLADTLLPNHVLIIQPSEAAAEGSSPLQPVLEGRQAVDGQPTLYICEYGTCRVPSVGTEAISSALDELTRCSS